MTLEEQFKTAASALIKQAKHGRVYAITLPRQDAADAAKALLHEGWYQAAKNWACLSFTRNQRFIPMDGPLKGCAVFSDYKTARDVAFNKLAKFDVSLMEVDPTKQGIYALKRYWVTSRFHNPNGMSVC